MVLLRLRLSQLARLDFAKTTCLLLRPNHSQRPQVNTRIAFAKTGLLLSELLEDQQIPGLQSRDRYLLGLCGNMSGSKWLAGLVVATCFAISISPAVGMKGVDRIAQDGMSNLVYIYVAGCISGAVLVPFLTHALKRAAGYLFLSKDESDHDLYRLDHGILNVEMPPASMWMNMGFWEVR